MQGLVWWLATALRSQSGLDNGSLIKKGTEFVSCVLDKYLPRASRLPPAQLATYQLVRARQLGGLLVLPSLPPHMQ